MSVAKYCVSWNSYENNICNGLSKLQQNEEFVDMTLVADGHLVKVHKNLLALASPYLKQIIQATPCQHPVIFFSNINHKILCHILEYIYTGETQVEVERLQGFLAAAKELKLPNIDNFLTPTPEVSEKITTNEGVPVETNVILKDQGDNNKDNCDVDMPVSFDNICDDIEDVSGVPRIDDLVQINSIPKQVENYTGVDTEMATEIINDMENFNNPIVLKIDTAGIIPQQYTVSNRGSLQLILNRYIYSSHHQALQGRKRRWRCIDYRLLHCQAFIDTLDENIIKRKNIHTHPYHDSKIMKKIKANLIFESISTAVNTSKQINSFKNTEITEDSD
ncbi:uncharacterized protein LOC123655578 [Melitaea cinxia]|uniref:uncharacterized protein LOC123655578 n=1 Tax=Melitaea cinxia TaxID=113334 RepID=UPI001E273F5A|nr:uncharacterized protein LOC123655578 [Melitaea cinxia]